MPILELLLGSIIYPPDFYPESTRRLLTEHLERAKKGEVAKLETALHDTKGNEVWFHTTFIPVRDEEGDIEYVIGVSIDTTERKQAEKAVIEIEKALRIKTRDLEELNAALKVLLRKGEEDRTEVEDNILSNVRTLIEPYLTRLERSPLAQSQMTLLNVIESNLREIVSPFTRRLSSKYLNFTPSEVQVANLIRHGAATKEIADFLNVTSRAIAFHRGNIRKKLGLTSRKSNLRTILLSLDQ